VQGQEREKEKFVLKMKWKIGLDESYEGKGGIL
jgi:hypothetical protein